MTRVGGCAPRTVGLLQAALSLVDPAPSRTLRLGLAVVARVDVGRLLTGVVSSSISASAGVPSAGTRSGWLGCRMLQLVWSPNATFGRTRSFLSRVVAQAVELPKLPRVMLVAGRRAAALTSKMALFAVLGYQVPRRRGRQREGPAAGVVSLGMNGQIPTSQPCW